MACTSPTNTKRSTADSGSPPVTVDADGDGVVADDDCDDTDPTTFPGADEVCDGVDNNCDERIDENAIDATAS